MKFGPASPADAIGGVTVHTLRQGALVLKKGTTIGPAEVEALTKAGVAEVVVVRLEEGDVSEDVAAASIAQAVAGDGVNVERAFTGRANLFAAKAGVLVVDRAAVDRINGVDEAITFATLAAFKPVVEGEMIATVKLIPFGVEAKLRDAAVAVAGQGALKIAPYTIKRVGVVSTLLPGLAPKVIEKTLRVTAERLAPAGATIIAERRVPHDETVLAASIKELLGLGAELVIVFGASAIADRRDVIPAAITEIGGAIEHFGMPVDPGNLLLIGSAGGVPVLGAPGCARSPVENGFDWVLMRLLAGLKVTRAELTGMGVGGLLMEIVTRPQPRTVAEIEANRNVAAIVLAAGRSTRMGGPNKLLAELDGKKLVRIVAEQALASKASEVIVVTGHQAELVEQALAGLKVQLRPQSGFCRWAGVFRQGRDRARCHAKADGAIVCLGDMPLIDAKLIDQLIETFAPDRGQLIVVPVSDGRRGNPVLWSRRFFRELMTLDGDIGARHLIAKHAEAVAEVAGRRPRRVSRHRHPAGAGSGKAGVGRSPPGFATNAPLVQFRSLAEEALLERSPFRIGRDLHQRRIDWPLQRAMLGQRDRHVGQRKQALRHLRGSRVAFRDQILQGADTVDHRVGFSRGQGVERFRQVFEFRVFEMMFVEIFGARGLRHRRQFFPGQIDIGGDVGGFDALGGQPRYQTC